MIFWKKAEKNIKMSGGILFIISLAATVIFILRADEMNAISPEIFQSFNPLFVVALTFPVMGLFAWLNKKNMNHPYQRRLASEWL